MPTGLLLCCAELGLPPSQCIYVGDAPTDGRAALATATTPLGEVSKSGSGSGDGGISGGGGVLGIGVSYGSHTAESLTPHFAAVVQTVDELGNALKEALRSPV